MANNIAYFGTVQADDEYMRYFVFSKQQLETFKKLNDKLGKQTVVPVVFVAGRRKEYTEMLKDPTKCRFSDYKIVAAGDIRTMKYTEWSI